MKPYTSKQKIEAYLGREIPSSMNATIDSYILAMSNQIDLKTNRVISRDGVEVFKYDGDGTAVTLIKDCVEVEEITLDGQVLDNVLQYPTNKPYTSRIVLGDGRRFPKGNQNIAVKAIQAMSKTVPADIELACTILVAGVIINGETKGRGGVSERIGNYQVSYGTKEQVDDFENAKAILSGYRRIAI